MALLYDPDLADRMVAMDRGLLQLLTTEITSFAQWDVLRFFVDTGSHVATMDQIAQAIVRDSATLVGVMGELTTRGWLARRSNAAGEAEYLLTQERDRRRLLDQLHASLHDRNFRLQAIYHWTRGR